MATGRPSDATSEAVRRRVAAWYLTPKEMRQPLTQSALAKELGVSPRTVSAHLADVRTWAEVAGEAGRGVRMTVPVALRALRAQCAAGNIEAIRTCLSLALTGRPGVRLDLQRHAGDDPVGEAVRRGLRARRDGAPAGPLGL